MKNLRLEEAYRVDEEYQQKEKTTKKKNNVTKNWNNKGVIQKPTIHT